MRRFAAASLAALAWFVAPAPGREEADQPRGEWLGSASCAECHPEIFERWKATTHARSIRPFSPEVVARPFQGEIFAARGSSQRVGPGPSMEVEGPGGGARRFPVDWVIGVRRVQMFTTRMEGGRIQVLPVFLEVPARKWFDYADFIFGGPSKLEIPPDSPNSWYHLARNFNSRCGECHMTGYEVGYDPDRGTYDTRWREINTSCESCHGPGAAHAAKWRRKDKGRDDPILNPARLSVERANQVCGYCHSERAEVMPGFRPGQDLHAFVDVNGLEDGKHLHPDGRARELIHNLVPAMESRCGPISCTKCHDPHGRGAFGDLHRPSQDDATCTKCHEGIGKDLEAHTHHAAASDGSRCVNCHMPPLVIEGGHGRVRDHTISIPSPENTDRHGTPNACRACHLDKEPGWEQEPFQLWYPGAEGRNHRVRVATAVAGGRAGDLRSREPLLDLLKDPNPVYRAGAAWMLSRYEVDLRPQLQDPHPMVRRAAIRGVGARHPEALEALLDDPSHVLRRAAAGELAERYEHVRARPELRDRLVGILQEFASRRPDDARAHFAIGALHALAGRTDASRRSYLRYLTLIPWDERVRREVPGTSGK
ncbi:MAG: HEAT repeat domain-containing protein [Planctomycetota bacterium]